MTQTVTLRATISIQYLPCSVLSPAHRDSCTLDVVVCRNMLLRRLTCGQGPLASPGKPGKQAKVSGVAVLGGGRVHETVNPSHAKGDHVPLENIAQTAGKGHDSILGITHDKSQQ